MDIVKIKEKYERKLKQLNEDIPEYEASNNNELIIASRTLKVETEKLDIIVGALEKQIPMEVHYEYDDEFTCPACNYYEDSINIKALKFCPDCGQKLKVE